MLIHVKALKPLKYVDEYGSYFYNEGREFLMEEDKLEQYKDMVEIVEKKEDDK